MFLKEALKMTKLVDSFKAGTAATAARGNVANGYRNKMFRAVGFVEMFRQHGLTEQEIENFSAVQQQQQYDK